jgi:hypothetical protein
MTLFLALVLSVLLCRGSVGSAVPVHLILALDHPAQTARAYFEHAIAVDQALASEPEWKRRVFQLALGTTRPALLEATDAYAEIILVQPRAFAPKADAQAATPEPASATPPSASSPSTSSSSTSSSSTSGADTAPAADAGPVTDSGGCSLEQLELPPKDDRATLTELLARLAILQGEAERPDDSRTSARRLEGLGEHAVASAISYAYEPLEPVQRRTFDSFDLSALDAGWARERLELRLAHRTGDAERERVLAEAAAARLVHLRERANVLMWIWLAPALVGLGLLLAWLLRDRPELARGNAVVPPEWTFEDGFAVLTRSLVFGLLVYLPLAFALKALHFPLAEVWALIVAPLPLLWLIHRGLLAPRVLSFVRTFGLDSLPGGAWRCLALVCALFAAVQLGGGLTTELLGRAGFETHWTERIDAQRLGADRWTFAGYAAVYVAWLPAINEVFCRGVLFLTLRTRMPLVPAALWSAALIGAFANASAPQFTGVIWAGFVLAFAFEKARSLLPLIACTALSYALEFLAYQLLYR